METRPKRRCGHGLPAVAYVRAGECTTHPSLSDQRGGLASALPLTALLPHAPRLRPQAAADAIRRPGGLLRRLGEPAKSVRSQTKTVLPTRR